MAVSRPQSGELVAVAEVALQAPDGLLPSNLPELPWVRRGEPRPYICNVAVAASARRQGVGRDVVRLCEQIARFQWGFEEVYLHVDPMNNPAVRLYLSMGFLVQNMGIDLSQDTSAAVSSSDRQGLLSWGQDRVCFMRKQL